MVIMVGIVAILVLKPKMIKIGQINSAITTRNNEGASPIPRGLPNSKLPARIFLNFGYPCVSIISEGAIRRIARPTWVVKLDFILRGILHFNKGNDKEVTLLELKANYLPAICHWSNCSRSIGLVIVEFKDMAYLKKGYFLGFASCMIA